ncbi:MULTISPECIES: hypothetical protein [unclassified Sphingomonas]|uniref:hypothetical protein n=1 Tax=unclassified Sphingomonas TaxID=196159 RepID=UPI0006F87CBF|nr:MULTISPECIES: hypothetical protein [unclassified Sphingomonas]KQM23831.1 hypothetical protein ASE58_16105 [Sphingomonas sp. Leaf9]KQM41958.1 hypothetical protein ASE57_16105 [Sphingomonas sp. Leaf11]
MKPMLPIAAAIDVAVVGLALSSGEAVLLFVHVPLVVLGYVLWLRQGRSIGFAAAMAGIFGPAALIGVGGIVARLPRTSRPPLPLPDRVIRARPARRGASLAVARMLDGRVLHAEPDTLHSLVTVMRHGKVADRRRALETVVRSFQPALSPLIALALTDSDQTIRALAAAASARVVQNLSDGRAMLEAKGADGEARATLIALLADHARANLLLSDSQRAHLRDDALALLDDATPHAVRIEALWAAGDYAAIDALVAAADPTPVEDDRMVPATAWWRNSAAA